MSKNSKHSIDRRDFIKFDCLDIKVNDKLLNCDSFGAESIKKNNLKKHNSTKLK